MRARALSTFGACAVLAAGVVSGCGKDDEGGSGSSGGGGGGAAEVKTDKGVTADTISLGLITDQSGVFAPLAIPLVDAKEAYWEQVNKDGGVCGRQVELQIRDNGYDVQKAVTQYRGIADEVVAFNELLGSPMTAALTPRLESDGTFAQLVSWSSELLDNESLVLTGATYAQEQYNALQYLMDEGKLAEGDKIGAVYFEGEYGEDGLHGAESFAEKNGMEVVQQKVQPTDTDMTAQVGALKRAGVKAISVTTTPPLYASVAGVAAGSGLEVPVIGNGPAFDPAVMDSPAAPAIEALGLVGASTVAYNSDAPGAKEARAAYEKFAKKQDPKGAVMFGWAQAEQMHDILETACEAGDLTREGLIEAVSQLEPTDYDGLMSGELDYSDIATPSTTATFVFKADAKAEGNLTQVAKIEGEAF